MLSSRTDWNLTPNALHQLLEEKRKKGERILDLTESNPTRCGFSYHPELLQALSSQRSLLYEPEPHGLLTARKGITGYYDRQGVLVDPSNIFLTASTSEAYAHLFRLLCNPGDNVLVPKPSYPLFDYLCTLNDVEVRHYRLQYQDGWEINLDSIKDAIDPSTRALLLVHPNNPTGSFVKKAENEAIMEIVQKHGLALIADEVFGDFLFEDVEGSYKSFAAEKHSLVFTLNGISKLLGLPQMKLAWITVSGETGPVHEAVNRLEIICDTYLSTGTPIQHALTQLLDDGQRVTDQIKKRIRTNYHSLR
jgi:alanine-synthesizing transaminase